jgi:diguanylate cyclase (GGDEF)-like protein
MMTSWLRLPRSLRGRFSLAVAVLSLLILAGGVAAVWALRHSSRAVQRLAQEQLVRMQAAQDLLQRTLFIEREAQGLLVTESAAAVQASHARIVRQMEALDEAVAGLSDANADVAVLDLHEASQLFRNTAHVVAQLREGNLQTAMEFDRLVRDRIGRLEQAPGAGAAPAAAVLDRLMGAQHDADVQDLRRRLLRHLPMARLPRALRDDLAVVAARDPLGPGAHAAAGDPFTLRMALINERGILGRFHARLQQQAEAMVAAARQQSTAIEADYRAALGQVVQTSQASQRSVLALLVASLLFAWLAARVFLGRHVVSRLLQVSRCLRRRDDDDSEVERLAQGRDEIADMARAVAQFRKDRRALEQRTAELSLAKEQQQEQGQVLEMIAARAPLEHILDRLARLIESQSHEVMASILLLDDDGLHLRHGAAPRLPKAYVEAIDGVAVGPDVGSCGTAVHRREPVIVTDIRTDPLWARYCTLAGGHGLRSCWSAPIFSHRGEVLGTFAMYTGEARAPSASDMRLVNLATRIAGIAIERQKAEERIQRLAHYDALTGLPNRALLRDRLGQALRAAERGGRGVAVAFIDLDDFKLINDSLGHGAGDALLRIMSQRIQACVRGSDTVARLGGDEFVVVLADQSGPPEAVRQTLQRIIDHVARPATLLPGRDVQVSCSAGLAFYPADGLDGEALLANADAAMYRAKELGRNNLQFYQHDMGGRSHERLALQDGLRRAIERDEFFLHYQPQVDLRTRRIIGVEALIRWRHPELGLVPPGKFIPLAEENGLILPIGDWVLQAACRQGRAWQDAGLPPVTMAVNVSARQFRDAAWTDRVAQALQDSGLAARHLELELTESMLMQDPAQAAARMRQLQAMGIQLAIDDFGTGYSSLGALKRFPLARLKIDQSFVRDIAVDEDDKAIVMAIIAMARRLNLKVLAEGVEAEAQALFLHECGCDEAQGYHFGRPMPAAAVGELLALQGATSSAGCTVTVG